MGQVDALFKFIEKQVETSVEKKCMELTQRLCMVGLHYRETNPQAHNFTGNLINSIVAALYYNGVEKYAEYASRTVGKPAIRIKMTAPRCYHFRQDWEGEESNIKAEVETNQGWGIQDASKFVKSYHPKTKGWVITLAYPVEYARFVEEKRQSTGIAEVEMEISSEANKIAKWIVNDVSLPMGDWGASTWDVLKSEKLSFNAMYADKVNNTANWIVTDNGNGPLGTTPMAPLPF